MCEKKYFYFILSVEGGSITLKNTFYKYFSSVHYGHKWITRLLKIATNLANAKLCMDWSTSKLLQILNTVPGMMLWFWSLRIIIKFHTAVLIRTRKILRHNFLIGPKKEKKKSHSMISFLLNNAICSSIDRPRDYHMKKVRRAKTNIT